MSTHSQHSKMSSNYSVYRTPTQMPSLMKPTTDTLVKESTCTEPYIQCAVILCGEDSGEIKCKTQASPFT